MKRRVTIYPPADEADQIADRLGEGRQADDYRDREDDEEETEESQENE